MTFLVAALGAYERLNRMRLALLAALLQGFSAGTNGQQAGLWPDGSYGLLMPSMGCPHWMGWDTGSILIFVVRYRYEDPKRPYVMVKANRGDFFRHSMQTVVEFLILCRRICV